MQFPQLPLPTTSNSRYNQTNRTQPKEPTMFRIPDIVPYDMFSKVISEGASLTSEEVNDSFYDYHSTDNSFPIWRVIAARLHYTIWIFKVQVFGYYKNSDGSYEGGPIIVELHWNTIDGSLKFYDVDFSDCSKRIYIPGTFIED